MLISDWLGEKDSKRQAYVDSARGFRFRAQQLGNKLIKEFASISIIKTKVCNCQLTQLLLGLRVE